MRLYDKILSAGKGENADLVRSLVSQTTVFCVDAIAEYYGNSPTIEWGPDMYPYAKPPWQYCMVEWNEPKSWTVGKVTQDNTWYQQAGLFCAAGGQDDVARLLSNSKEVGHKQLFDGIESEAEAAIIAYPFLCKAGAVHGFDLRCAVVTKSDGWVLRLATTGAMLNGLSKEAERGVNGEMGGFLRIASLAFTFANCCNVKLDDITDEVAPSPKIRRRLKLPEVKRYTLRIAGHAARPRRESDDPQKGIMPFHLCRGHFAEYTAEKPLFGKHVGRFWIPPHVKGKKERGEVIKDYRVEDKNESANGKP